MKFRYLDGLRGLAALVVVIDHFAISFFPAATDGTVHVTHGALEPVVQRTPLHLLVSGNFAVCIFFVLSGVVLSAKFFRTRDHQAVIASASKRYLRLALPVMASVALAFALMATHAFRNTDAAAYSGSDWLASFWQFTPNLAQAAYHATIGVFVHGTSGYNSVLWTMKTELLGSFLVFGLLLVAGRWRVRWRWLLYGALALALIKTYYVAFILGLAACDYHFNGNPRYTAWLQRWYGWVPLLLVSLFLGSSPVGTLHGTVFQYLQPVMPIGLSVTTTTHILGAIGLVGALLASSELQRPFNTRPVQYLGAISFSLYLTHLLILGSLSSFLFTKTAPALGYRPGFLVMALASGAVMLLTAHLFTRYVDQPAIRFSTIGYRGYSWLTTRWRVAKPAAGQPAKEPARTT